MRHTEVRWLSKGACLTRFYILYDTVMEFFEEMLKDKETTEKLIILKMTWHIFPTYSSC